MESNISFELPKLNKEFENGKSYPLSRAKFDFIKLIGTGGFGKVYHVISIFSKNHYAMKVLSKSQIENYELEHQLMREIRIFDSCRHPNIVHLYACFEDSK